MITEQQQEQAALAALGLLGPDDQERFAAELRSNDELRKTFRELQASLDKVALSVPPAVPPAGLKAKVMKRILGPAKATPRQQPTVSPTEALAGLRFVGNQETAGWKQLPIPGASLKLLSLEPERGYAVLLGKLEPGVRYPAHTNAGPEDFYILTGDLHVSGRVLGPGDFHHADAGSAHEENYSVQGCTLLAVLTTDDPLVAFAMS